MARPTNEVANPTPERQILHEMNISNGRYSKRVLGGSTLESPSNEVYGWIMALEETTITTISDYTLPEATPRVLDGIVLDKGMSMPGLFYDITIAAGGKLVCFTNVIVP